MEAKYRKKRSDQERDAIKSINEPYLFKIYRGLKHELYQRIRTIDLRLTKNVNWRIVKVEVCGSKYKGYQEKWIKVRGLFGSYLYCEVIKKEAQNGEWNKIYQRLHW